MKTVDIMETLTSAIDETIFQKWKHEGFIGGFTSEHINFEIDGKEYVLQIEEVKDGEHWSEKLKGNTRDCSNCRRANTGDPKCKECVASYDARTRTTSTPSCWQPVLEN